MDAQAIEWIPCAADTPDAVACLEAYFGELAALFPEGFDASLSISASVEETQPPHGLFLMAYHRGKPLGCGAVKMLAPGIGEIKRMWIDHSARGMGIGKQLLQKLEAQSQALGHRIVRLDTSVHLKRAIAFYQSAGYREIPDYNGNPYAAYWFEKSLPTPL